jgi:hypothetical protein
MPGATRGASRRRATDGVVDVEDPHASCASDAKVLSLTPRGDADATTTLSLPVPHGSTPPEKRTWTVVPRVVQRGGAGEGTIELVTQLGAPPVVHWTWTDGPKSSNCLDLPSQSVELGGKITRAWLVVHAHGGPVYVDKTTLKSK